MYNILCPFFTAAFFAIFILSISSVREISSCYYGIMLLVFEYTSTTISPIMSERSERFIFNILQHPRLFLPSVYSYGRLLRHFLSFPFHLFERFHSILVLYRIWISIWIILSTHRPRYRLLWASAASDSSYNIPVHSYLRSFLTATFFAIFYSFHFMCSRDFILYRVIMLLVFESFSQHIDSDIAYHERAQRAIHPTTSPSILTFGLFLRPPHSPFFILSISSVREISFYPSNGIMVLWYYGIMILWYYDIMVLWY